MLTSFGEIMPFNDLVAVSRYPFIRGSTSDIDGFLRWLTEHFDGYRKPYVFVEVGEPTERLRLPSSSHIIDGTAKKHVAFHETLHAYARHHEVRFVVSFLHRDYDALWESRRSGRSSATPDPLASLLLILRCYLALPIPVLSSDLSQHMGTVCL